MIFLMKSYIIRFILILLISLLCLNHIIANANDLNLQLVSAAEKGKTGTVKILISKGANVNGTNENNETPLILSIATISGQAEIVDILLINKAEVNAQDKNGVTPLILAAYYGHTNIIQSLLQNGADKSHRNITGHSALAVATSKNHLEINRLLK